MKKELIKPIFNNGTEWGDYRVIYNVNKLGEYLILSGVNDDEKLVSEYANYVDEMIKEVKDIEFTDIRVSIDKNKKNGDGEIEVKNFQ